MMIIHEIQKIMPGQVKQLCTLSHTDFPCTHQIQNCCPGGLFCRFLGTAEYFDERLRQLDRQFLFSSQDLSPVCILIG